MSIYTQPERRRTDAALKHRMKALEALFKIEIEFARLRDRLYLERMEEVVRDREAVEAGQYLCPSYAHWPCSYLSKGVHPEFVLLNDLIEKRRASKLDLASKTLEQLNRGFEREITADERVVWSDWAVRFPLSITRLQGLTHATESESRHPRRTAAGCQSSKTSS